MAKYKRRADGRYATSVTIGYTPEGRRKQRKLYGRTIKELDDKVAEFRAQLQKGIVIADEGLSVREWGDQWLALYKSDVAYNTSEMYRSALRVHIYPAIGDRRLGSLKPSHVQSLISKILKDGKARTAEIVRLTLGQMIDQAIAAELIHKDIMRGVKLPKRQRPQKRALTEEERTQIASADLDMKARAFLEVLLYAGLRRGEALALTRRDISGGAVTVSKTVIFKGNAAEVKPIPKSEAGTRIIPLPQVLADTLRRYMDTLGGDLLFPKAKSEAVMTRSSLRKFWGGIKRQLGWQDSDVTPHILRHSYATSLYYSGVDVKAAQYLLGHASVQITLDIYTHLEQSTTADAVSKLDTYIKKISEGQPGVSSAK